MATRIPEVVVLKEVAVRQASNGCHVSHKSAKHHGQLSIEHGEAWLCEANIQKTICDAWYDACNHNTKSYCKCNLLPATEPLLKTSLNCFHP